MLLGLATPKEAQPQVLLVTLHYNEKQTIVNNDWDEDPEKPSGFLFERESKHKFITSRRYVVRKLLLLLPTVPCSGLA